MYLDFIERDNSWTRLYGKDINYIDIFNLIIPEHIPYFIGRTSNGDWCKMHIQAEKTLVKNTIYSASFKIDDKLYVGKEYYDSMYFEYKRRSKLERIIDDLC